MVVYMPKRRKVRKVVFTSVSFSIFLLLAMGATIKMAVRNGSSKDEAEQDVVVVRRSLPQAPLHDLQTLFQWKGVQVGEKESEISSLEIPPSTLPLTTAATPPVTVTGEGDVFKLDSIISQHLSICKRPTTTLRYIMGNTSHPYNQLVKTTLAAVHTFVPAEYDPRFKNPCWFAKMPALPPALHKNFTEYRGCMPNVEETYTTKAAMNIVKTALRTPASGKELRTLPSNYSRVPFSPPRCQNMASDLVYSPPSPDNLSVYASTSTNGSALYNQCVKKHDLFCMPQVLLAGFPKCATSTLYYTMMKHPQVSRSRMKEEHLWRDLFISEQLPHKQLQTLYYIFHFERASRDIFLYPDHITIDGSTTTVFPGLYLPMNQDEDMCVLPRLMANVIPSVRIVLMMRNPIDRLYSDYWYLCSKIAWKKNRKIEVPKEYLTNGTKIFHENTEKMIIEFNECIKHKTVFECVRIAGVGYAPEVACKGPRIGLSLYYYHIIRWLNVLPRNQIYFLRTEDFLADSHSAMTGVYKFLGLSPPERWMTQLTSKNINTWIKSSAYKDEFTMPENTRQMLREFFEPYNRLLSRLLKDSKYMWDDIEDTEPGY